MQGCEAAPAPWSSLPSPLCPQSSRRTVAAGLVECRAQRGALDTAFTGHGLRLSAQSLKLPGPLLCRQSPTAPALCPARTAPPWVVQNGGGGGGWRGEPPVSHVCPFHLLSRQEGRGCGNPGHVACARVALSPSGVRTGISSGFVSPTFILTVTAGDLLPQVQETLAALAAVEGMDGSQDLFRARVSPLLEWLAASHRDWTGHSVELLQLDVVLSHSGEPGRVPRAGFRAWVPWRQPQRRRAALLSPPSRPRTRPGSSFTRDHCRLWGLATLHPYFKKC